MPQDTYLTANSTLFWLTALIAAGIIFIGARFIVAPIPAFLAIAALIQIGDLLKVYAHVQTRNVPALMIHGGTPVFMCVLAAILLRG